MERGCPVLNILKLGDPWRLKMGKRARRQERWLQSWCREYGFRRPCAICAVEHAAMEGLETFGGKTMLRIVCPVALWGIWPPTNEEDGNKDLWDSLEACPYKMADIHGYNQAEVDEALLLWETVGQGSRLTDVERHSFKTNTNEICEDTRQSWKFKRSIISHDSEEEEDDRS